MLTADYIFKVAALDDQTGEPPPGYLHDGDSALDGQSAASDAPALPEQGAAPSRARAKGNSYRLVLERRIDSKTGEPRLVQK